AGFRQRMIEASPFLLMAMDRGFAQQLVQKARLKIGPLVIDSGVELLFNCGDFRTDLAVLHRSQCAFSVRIYSQLLNVKPDHRTTVVVRIALPAGKVVGSGTEAADAQVPCKTSPVRHQ